MVCYTSAQREDQRLGVAQLEEVKLYLQRADNAPQQARDNFNLGYY
jgi:hypothetical protein